MIRRIDVKLVSTIVFTGLIAFIVVYMFISMMAFSDNTEGAQTERIVDVLRKASIQCYALEGSYPPSLEYLADKYEVILDKENYIYFYYADIGNSMPDIQVFAKTK